MSGQYAEGAFTKEAETRLQQLHGKPMVAMSSCGSALLTAFRWYHMRGHVGVAVQNNTFHATGAMALEAGLSVVLIDSRSDCPSMSLESLMAAHKKARFSVVCLTHVGGWIAKDYEPIAEWCRQNGIKLMEDCAHVLGVPGPGMRGEIACWSFYPTKSVPIGDGGALSSSDALVVEFAETFRNYGKYKELGVIRYTQGLNLRISEWNAAVLCVQLESLNEILKKRADDAQKLQSIAPCLLSGPTNWYKYPVARAAAEGFRTVGAIYGRSDQLDESLFGLVEVEQPVSLTHSWVWAGSHVCLPIGEGLYDGLTEGHVRGVLTQ